MSSPERVLLPLVLLALLGNLVFLTSLPDNARTSQQIANSFKAPLSRIAIGGTVLAGLALDFVAFRLVDLYLPFSLVVFASVAGDGLRHLFNSHAVGRPGITALVSLGLVTSAVTSPLGFIQNSERGATFLESRTQARTALEEAMGISGKPILMTGSQIDLVVPKPYELGEKWVHGLVITNWSTFSPYWSEHVAQHGASHSTKESLLAGEILFLGTKESAASLLAVLQETETGVSLKSMGDWVLDGTSRNRIWQFFS